VIPIWTRYSDPVDRELIQTIHFKSKSDHVSVLNDILNHFIPVSSFGGLLSKAEEFRTYHRGTGDQIFGMLQTPTRSAKANDVYSLLFFSACFESTLVLCLLSPLEAASYDDFTTSVGVDGHVAMRSKFIKKEDDSGRMKLAILLCFPISSQK
jgi:hypothetical protein